MYGKSEKFYPNSKIYGDGEIIFTNPKFSYGNSDLFLLFANSRFYKNGGNI